MKALYLLILIVSLICCSDGIQKKETLELKDAVRVSHSSIIVLGTIQDAGSPQIACKKNCCANLFSTPDLSRKIVSLGLIDAENKKTYLFEATPDIITQMNVLAQTMEDHRSTVVDGIFLTHAHIGHYAGLMFLGKEAMDAKEIPTYVMPSMKIFLENNGPWNQLVERKNIVLREMLEEQSVQISKTISVTPFLVPHRDEYSKTVGYKITGPNKSALFIPDIDKWSKWEKNIVEEIKKVDFAFLDATFYSGREINNRDVSEIPHPFMVESVAEFASLPTEEKNKIIFIHFNHTNPVINPLSDEAQFIKKQGFHIARIHDVFEL